MTSLNRDSSGKQAMGLWTKCCGLSVPALVLCILAGAALGTGSYTARYAEAFSYLSNDPKACVFHAPQESARVLGEAIDYARQGQIRILSPK